MNLRVAQLLFCFAATSLQAQQCTLTTPSDTFHIGERIPITASFSAPVESHVRVMIPQETRRPFSAQLVEVTPSSGWIDPESNFKGPMVVSYLMSMPVELTPTPHTVTLDLNDYVRFNQPGDYTVVVRTNQQPRPFNSGMKVDSLQSAALKLHILATTPEWQAATLSHALEELKTLNAHPQQETLQRRNALYATIADLGTEASYRAMAADLGDADSYPATNRIWLYQIALQRAFRTSPEVVLASMRSVMDTPDVSLGSSFIGLWIQMRVGNVSPEQYGERNSAAWYEIVATLPNKTLRARDETADVLTRSGPRDMQSRAALRPHLVEGFRNLPLDRQETALQMNWPILRSPVMLPILQQLAQRPVLVFDPIHDPEHADLASENDRLRGVALRRWYELDHAGATAWIQQQIGTEHPTYKSTDLSFLPPDPMPQYEGLWAAALPTSNEEQAHNLSALLARFGTGTAVAQVGAYVDAGIATQPCGTFDPAAVGYLVRFDTDHARQVLHTIHNQPDANRCSFGWFTYVSQNGHGPALEESAIEALKDGMDSVASVDAANYLQRFGTTAARQPLEKRFAILAADPDVTAAQNVRDPSPQAMERMQKYTMAETIFNALLAPQGWTPTQDEIASLISCGADFCRSRRGHNINNYKSLTIAFVADAFGSPEIELYPFPGRTLEELRSKLAQLPAGTVISMNNSDPDFADLEAKVREAIESAHLTLRTP